jgi:hypothetical protein
VNSQDQASILPEFISNQEINYGNGYKLSSKRNLIISNSKFKQCIKVDLKLSVPLEPIWVFSIPTIIRADARFHIPFIRKNKNTRNFKSKTLTHPIPY